MTQEEIDRMKRTIERMKKERPGLVAEVTRTQEMGDLSENAGYQDAKYRLRKLDGSIESMQERIKYAVPIAAGADAQGRIRTGSVVRIASNDNTYTYRILGSQESDPLNGAISYSSPLGNALLGHSVGDKVPFTTPSGEITYEILEIN